MKNIPISTIVSKCKEQDPAAQRELYDMYVLNLYNVSYRILLSREDAEDAVHKAFVKAFAKIDTYKTERGHISSWLAKICINESIAIFRKRKVRFDSIDDKLTIASSEPSKLEHLEAEYIYKAINMLSDQQRVIFNLFEVEGYSHKEVALLLDMNENTCRAYLSRAKVNLRELLKVNFPDQVNIF